MTDGPIASFALGTLAVSRGVSETAALAVAVCSRPATSVNEADLHALIAENQQLHALNAALVADIVALKAYAKELEAWGDKLAARLTAKTD